MPEMNESLRKSIGAALKRDGSGFVLCDVAAQPVPVREALAARSLSKMVVFYCKAPPPTAAAVASAPVVDAAAVAGGDEAPASAAAAGGAAAMEEEAAAASPAQAISSLALGQMDAAFSLQAALGSQAPASAPALGAPELSVVGHGCLPLEVGGDPPHPLPDAAPAEEAPAYSVAAAATAHDLTSVTALPPASNAMAED